MCLKHVYFSREYRIVFISVIFDTSINNKSISLRRRTTREFSSVAVARTTRAPTTLASFHRLSAISAYQRLVRLHPFRGDDVVESSLRILPFRTEMFVNKCHRILSARSSSRQLPNGIYIASFSSSNLHIIHIWVMRTELGNTLLCRGYCVDPDKIDKFIPTPAA